MGDTRSLDKGSHGHFVGFDFRAWGLGLEEHGTQEWQLLNVTQAGPILGTAPTQ